MLGFLIAAAAGFLTPQLEGPIGGPVAKALEGYIPVTADEKRLITFMVALLGAVILSAALNTGSTLGIIVGAILGYFGTRIFTVLKKVIDGRTGAD